MFKREIVAKIAASIAVTLLAGWITKRITRRPAASWVVGVFVGTIAHELLDAPLTRLLSAEPAEDEGYVLPPAASRMVASESPPSP